MFMPDWMEVEPPPYNARLRTRFEEEKRYAPKARHYNSKEKRRPPLASILPTR
tara:strand:- start:428 stop:586 length:159 start_codon:yes stop_codon:yes gene_type:complete